MMPYSMLRFDYSKYEQLWRGENLEKFKETCAKNRKKRKSKKK
jgi:hypothetical protein